MDIHNIYTNVIMEKEKAEIMLDEEDLKSYIYNTICSHEKNILLDFEINLKASVQKMI